MRRSIPAHACLHRLVAVLGIALVLTLNVLAAWPAAHSWVHASDEAGACPHDHAHDPVPDDGGEGDRSPDDCVIVKFAQGGAVFLAAPTLLLPPRPTVGAAIILARAFPAASPAHLLPPGRGPPAV